MNHRKVCVVLILGTLAIRDIVAIIVINYQSDIIYLVGGKWLAIYWLPRIHYSKYIVVAN